MPGLRQLGEAPILDSDEFKRQWIPSDKRYKAVFPHDHDLQCKAKDLKSEQAVLIEYLDHVNLTKD